MTIDSNGSMAPPAEGVDRRPLREDFVRQLTWVLNSKDISHRDLAEGVGWPNHTRLYRWLNYKAEPLPHEVFAMERWMDLPPGFLSRPLGYLPPEARSEGGVPWEEAMASDPTLPDRAKRIIRTVIAEFKTEGKPRRR